ncbi:hypothetical protein KM043_003335 [Ampulex compressa]|nr:hypothetical protein KM043_003335 [Ampulex compressa]
MEAGARSRHAWRRLARPSDATRNDSSSALWRRRGLARTPERGRAPRLAGCRGRASGLLDSSFASPKDRMRRPPRVARGKFPRGPRLRARISARPDRAPPHSGEPRPAEPPGRAPPLATDRGCSRRSCPCVPARRHPGTPAPPPHAPTSPRAHAPRCVRRLPAQVGSHARASLEAH